MLRTIQDELHLKKKDLERELKLDTRTIEKLLADTDDEENSWRLDREALHRLFLFAHRHGFPPFEIEPNPIWTTLIKGEVTIFRGPTPADAPVENHLAEYFRRLDCQVRASFSSEGLEEAMKELNCVIIGSPKSNPASEVALAALWGAEPFNDAAQNRDKIPVSFLGMQNAPNTLVNPKVFSAVLQESSRCGLHVRLPGTRDRKFLRADWLPPEKFEAFKGTGQDVAILVACRQPFGTKNNVTTIIIAGYTGLATLTAAKEATYKNIPDLQPEKTPGQPSLAILKFTFRKRRQYGPPAGNLRSIEKDSPKWAPPWDDFFS